MGVQLARHEAGGPLQALPGQDEPESERTEGMTAQELLNYLAGLASEGYDLSVPVYFDTEARTFDYHMAKIGRAYYETEGPNERPFLNLVEARP